MGREKQAVGKAGEVIARQYLLKKGYEVMAANARTPFGEIDLVTRHRHAIVFIEVKTRRSSSLGPPFLNVTPLKQRRIILNALCFLKSRGLLRASWRIDVVSVKLAAAEGMAERIDHFENAVEDNG